MEITITINGVEYRFRISAATTYLYKQQFGKDLIKAFQSIEGEDDSESITILGELAYIANKQAGGTDKGFIEWLEQFTTMELYKEILPPVAKLWRDSNKTTSRSKK